MAWELIDNIRGKDGRDGRDGRDGKNGEKGDKGDTGSISSISGEMVGADQPFQVIMSGTPDVKHLHIKMPRGLPGMNAAPSAEAVAAYLVAQGSPANTALIGLVPVYRVWDGFRYPPRIPGALNIFFGPERPGVDVFDVTIDTWVNPYTVTLDDIATALRDTSSDVYAAAALAGTGESFFVPHTLFDVVGPSAPSKGYIGPDPRIGGWLMTATTPNPRVGAEVRSPKGWGSVRLSIVWTHGVETPGSTAVRWETNTAQMEEGFPFTNGTQQRYGTGAVPAQFLGARTVTSESGGGVPVNPAGGQLRIAVTRRRDSADDTFGDTAVFRGVLVERLS